MLREELRRRNHGNPDAVTPIVSIMATLVQGNDPPLLWETLVVGGGSDGYVKRHATARDADRFHSRAVLIAFSDFGNV